MSTFSGIIAEFPGVSVDNFAGKNLSSTLFFLSHCHRDHMNGLDSQQFAGHLSGSRSRKLYCSPGSASILRNHGLFKLPSQTLSKIVELEIQSELFINLTDENDQEIPEMMLSVTMIPANHCPGSVMFVFKNDRECVLYTGDFRFYRHQLSKADYLLELAGSVSTLYLDTTFAQKRVDNSFVSRLEAIQTVCQSIERWERKYPEGRVCILTKAEFGYEAVFEEIMKYFRKPVHVCDYKYDLYDGMPEIQKCLTRLPETTNFHACHTRSQDFCVAGIPDKKTLLITLCAMTFSLQEYMGLKSRKITPAMEKIAYSMHCSMEELIDFVELIQPRKIVPCVIPRGSCAESVLKLFRKELVITSRPEAVPEIYEPAFNVAHELVEVEQEGSESSDGFVPPVRPSKRVRKE